MVKLRLLLALACLMLLAPVQAAERIISLAPSLTEMLYDLGVADKLVGRQQGGTLAMPLEHVPILGEAGQLDMELVLRQRPDLVLYWPGSVSLRQLQQLEQSNIAVFHVSVPDMRALARQYQRLGEQLGVAERGAQVARQIEERLAVLQQNYANKPPVRLFYQLWDRPMFTLGGGQIVTDALQYCGAHNIFADLDIPAPQVNIEMVLARKPQLLLLSHSSQRGSWPAGLQLPVLLVPDDGLDRPSLQMLDGLEQLCAAIDEFRSN